MNQSKSKKREEECVCVRACVCLSVFPERSSRRELGAPFSATSAAQVLYPALAATEDESLLQVPCPSTRGFYMSYNSENISKEELPFNELQNSSFNVHHALVRSGSPTGSSCHGPYNQGWSQGPPASISPGIPGIHRSPGCWMSWMLDVTQTLFRMQAQQLDRWLPMAHS